MTKDFIRRVAFVAVAVAAPVASGFAEPAPGRFDAMLERPLFSPTRRPPPVVSDALALAPPAFSVLQPPDIALSGIISGNGVGVALVRRPQDAGPTRVAVGGQIGGWTVTEIRPRAIVIKRDTRTVTLDLSASPR